MLNCSPKHYVLLRGAWFFENIEIYHTPKGGYKKHKCINVHCRRGFCFVKPEDEPPAAPGLDPEADPDLDDEDDDKVDAEIVARLASELKSNITDFMGWRTSYRKGHPEDHAKEEPKINKRLKRKLRNLDPVKKVISARATRHRPVAYKKQSTSWQKARAASLRSLRLKKVSVKKV